MKINFITFDFFSIRSGRGYCLIINQEFQGIDKWRRHGSQHDVDKLEKTFKSFGFVTRTERDLKIADLLRVFEETVQILNTNDYASLAVFILSHGKEKSLIMTLECNRFFDVDELPTIFSNSNCPGLRSSPRMFFINACRGTNANEIVPTGARADGINPIPRRQQHQQPPTGSEIGEADICDYVICHSTTVATPSFR